MSPELDEKIADVFPAESVNKGFSRSGFLQARALPSFIKDWLIKRFSTDNVLDELGLEQFIRRHIPDRDQVDVLKSDLISHKGPIKVLTRFVVQPDIGRARTLLIVPDLGIKQGDGYVLPRVLEQYKEELLGNEAWGVGELAFEPPENHPDRRGKVVLVDFRPFRPYQVDLGYYRQAREAFSLEEWIDLLVRSMEYNPDGFENKEQKLLMISRLLPFVEERLNLIELAPKGTGKSYVFRNLSKYGWLLSGGVVSRAKLFFDMRTQTPGIISRQDFVALDEIQTIHFTDPDEIRGALKGYLESGVFTVMQWKHEATAGFVLLGNIPMSSARAPSYANTFATVPEIFKESALLDRFHAYLHGWKLPRIREDLKVTGLALNVEYFSEILHQLRFELAYAAVTDAHLRVPARADTRDVNAVRRLACGYLKLLFPHAYCAERITRDEFQRYCLGPAIELRANIRRELSLMDPEYPPEMPDIEAI